MDGMHAAAGEFWFLFGCSVCVIGANARAASRKRYYYSQLSADGHSLPTVKDILNSRFYLSQTPWLRITVSGNSLVSGRGHIWIWIFFSFFNCLRCLVRGHPTYCINWHLWKSNRSVVSVGIGLLKLSVRLKWHQQRVSVAILNVITPANWLSGKRTSTQTFCGVHIWE